MSIEKSKPSNPSGRRKGSKSEPTTAVRFFGDTERVKGIFAPNPRKPITLLTTTAMRRAICQPPQGASGFMEDAILSFDGNLPALWEAARTFCDARKSHEDQDNLCHTCGRISKEAMDVLNKIQEALVAREVVGVSRAKVLAGLVELKLRSKSQASSKARTRG